MTNPNLFGTIVVFSTTCLAEIPFVGFITDKIRYKNTIILSLEFQHWPDSIYC